MFTKYYYLRFNENGKLGRPCSESIPTGGFTICKVYQDDGKMAIGISRCSGKDKFIKKLGRHKARGRAIQALERGTTETDETLNFEDEIESLNG